MFQAMISLFTGNGKIFGFATIVLGVLLLTCSIYTGVKVASLNGTIETQKEDHAKEIKTLKNEHKEAIENLQKEKEELQDTVSKVEALSEQERADAKRNAELGAKKQKEVVRSYEERLKRFKEKTKEVKDYGQSDSSIIDAAGI